MANSGMGGSFDPNDMSSWYFHGMTRKEATDLLLNETESGVFLVRDSKSIVGNYVLCVKEAGRVSNYIIDRIVSPDGSVLFRIGDQVFVDMAALLSFYRVHYLDTTALVRPYARTAIAHQPPQQNQTLEIVIAKFDFAGNDADDLPFRRGEKLAVVSRDEEQWWTARNVHGRTGSIPVPYVQRMADMSADSLEAPAPPVNKNSHLTNMERKLPALARVRQARVPNAYDKTALKLEEGDIIKVTKININGQWVGELNGRTGHFPFTYVEFLDENTPS